LGVGESFGGLDDSDLLAIFANEPDFGYANPVVDPSQVPLRRAPVKFSRDRH